MTKLENYSDFVVGNDYRYDANYHTSMLDFLEDSKVITVYKNGNDFVISENCDGHFFAHVTRDQMVLLVNELQELLDVN